MLLLNTFTQKLYVFLLYKTNVTITDKIITINGL